MLPKIHSKRTKRVAKHLSLALSTAAFLLASLAGCEIDTGPPPLEAEAPETNSTVKYPAGSTIPRTYLAPTSVEELVFLSDIIARVRFISADSGIQPVYVQNKLMQQAAFAFRFQVLEYLKGSGSGELSVKVPVDRLGTSWLQYMSADSTDALGIAEAHFATRDTRWDSREAIVFLKAKPASPSGQGTSGALVNNSLQFTDIGESSSNIFRYAISSDKNKAWLPAVNASAATGAATTDQTRYFTAEPPQSSDASGASASSASSISLADIKRFIEENGALLAENNGVPYYKNCLTLKFRYTALYEIGWYMETRYETEIPSGMRPGSVEIWEDIEEGDPYYGTWWIEGPNTHLFTMTKEDPDNDPTTGYKWKVSANRPLPSGKYIINYDGQSWITVPCNFNPNRSYINEQTLIATAPDGVLHEAFFDPAPLGIGVGANSASGGIGALKPAEFTHNGAAAAIEQIEWSPNLNKATLKLSNQSVNLTGYHIDFIELDASVSLRLDFDDAETTTAGYGQTLSWEVCRQPWHPGDLLMLRIAKSDTTDSVTIKPTCVQDKDAPTATPTPKTTPTHTPTATATSPADAAATPTPTAPLVPTATPTNTPLATNTPAPTSTPEPTPTPSDTGGATSAIDTPTPTSTATPTLTPTPEPPPGGVTGQ